MKQAWPNSTYSTMEYDSMGRLVKLSNLRNDGTVLSIYTYVYTARGNRSTRSDGTSSLNYCYDVADQLTYVGSDSCSTAASNPTYDTNGAGKD